MRLFKPLSIRSFLLTVLVGVFSLIPAAAVIAQEEFPPGDLTVTVEEQENGDVKFSLSGTAYMQGFSSGMSVMNRSNNFDTPPANPDIYGSYVLPPGLTLTMQGGEVTSEIEAPEEGLPPVAVYGLQTLHFDEFWELGYFSGGYLSRGDTITGAGSVTAKYPFSWFVPGTFLVSPGDFSSSPEGGIYPYSVTYKVIPFVRNLSLTLSKPGAFPKTILRKSGGTKKVTIRNNGNTPLTGLNLSISVPGDFSSSTLPKMALAPGESTSVDVTFRPKSRGRRTATLTVKGLHTPRQPEDRSAVKRGTKPVEDFAPEPIEVSASTSLSGEGKAKPRPKPRPKPTTESPRSVSRPR